MDQTVPTSPPIPKPLPKFWQQKKFLVGLAAFLTLLIIIPTGLFLTSRQTQKPLPPPSETRTWELTLSFSNLTHNLSLKKLAVLDKTITQDFRSATNSPYEIVVLDKSGRALFRTKINITKQLIYNILNLPVGSPSADLTLSPSLDTLVYIPYSPAAEKIQITEKFTPVLEINVTPELSFNLVPEVMAQTTPNSCGPLQVVLISDGYSSQSQFQQDAAQLKSILSSIAPYSSTPSMFDYKELYNTTSLGCLSGIGPRPEVGRYTGCIFNPLIQSIGRNAYPSASKFIVLVNNPNAEAVDGGAYGFTNDIGGDMAVFTNRADHGLSKFEVAPHEFLGHAVGELYDRYVSKVPGYGPLIPGNRSNCTDNQSGEKAWQDLGINRTFPGCSNPAYFAPTTLDCPSQNPILANGGSKTSLMSALKCGGNTFDPVETKWIQTKIIPKYQIACNTPQQTTPTTPPTTAPTTGTGSNNPYVTSGNFVQGQVYVDLNRDFAFQYGGFPQSMTTGSRTALEPAFNDAAIQLDDNFTVTTGPHPNADPNNPGQNGYFIFNNLAPGRHTLTLTVPAGYEITTPNPQIIDSFAYSSAFSSLGYTQRQDFTLIAPNKISFQSDTANTSIWFGIAPITETPRTPQATTPGASTSGAVGVYVCEEVPPSGTQGNQVQIKTLRCSLR